MRFDISDLRLFLHVAELDSITHGAQRAHMALASASERIRGMEETSGVALLNRHSRGVSLTSAGEAVAYHARIILRQQEQMRSELSQYAAGLRGHIRVMANTAAVSEFLPEALAAFLSQHPDIDVDLAELPSREIIEALADGKGDFGITTDAVDTRDLEKRPFRTDRLVLIVPPAHPFAHKTEIAFSETLTEPFIGLMQSSALQTYLGNQASVSGKTIKLRVRLNGIDAVCQMVETGVGIGIVPEAALARRQASTSLVAIKLQDQWALRHLTICSRSFAALSPPAQRLAEHLAS